MPEGYHHLTYEERCQIYALMQSGEAAIARQLGVHRSTMKRELDRNTGGRTIASNRRRRRRRKNENQPRVRHAR